MNEDKQTENIYELNGEEPGPVAKSHPLISCAVVV